MQSMNPDVKQKIVAALQEKGAILPCPRCGNSKFTLVDGYVTNIIQQELKGLVLGGPAIPSIVVLCDKCGYLSQHALGVLGLMPVEDERDEQKTTSK